MAKKTSLREFQAYLAERLSTAAGGQGAAAWLGLLAGGTHWLIDLADSGEIVQAPQVVRVPLTQPWFAGMANIRGNLHAVTDFSAFCGGAPTAMNASTRLLLVGVKFGSNAALLVPQMLGLKKPEEFTGLADADGQPAWRRQRLVDAGGTHWTKLSVRELLADPHFMNIGV